MKRFKGRAISGGWLVLALLLIASADVAASRSVLDGGLRAAGRDAMLVQDPGAEVVISVEQLGEHVLLARVGDQPEIGQVILNNVVAIGASSGIAVVDTGYFPQSAYRLRELLADALASESFEYVVNTHWHWDHHNGNQAFRDATIVANTGIVPALERFEEDLDSFLLQRRERLTAWREVLSAAPEGSDEALEARGWAFAHAKFLEEVEAGYEVVYPEITFSDRLTLRLRDREEWLDVELISVPPFHSDHDVIVAIPDDGVVALGDVFFPGELPRISEEHAAALPDFVRSMAAILADHAAAEVFVPGHGRLMSRQDVMSMVRYLTEVAQMVAEAKSAGMGLVEAQRTLSLEDRFDYVLGIGDPAAHQANIEVLWGGPPH